MFFLSDDNYVTITSLSGERLSGKLSFCNEGPRVILPEGQAITPNSGISHYEMETSLVVGIDGKRRIVSLNPPLKINFRPEIITKLSYSLIPRIPEDIFPPSSDYWYGRLGETGIVALYSIQKILNESDLWLTIVNTENWEIVEAHRISPYEIYPLSIIQDVDLERKIFEFIGKKDSKDTTNPLQILNGPAPSMERLSNLVEDVEIPSLHLCENLRSTVDQLVPTIFEKPIREEIMSFLAWILTENEIKEDPVEYFNNLGSTPVFHALLMGHLQCIIENKEPPHYVKILKMASMDALRPSRQSITEKSESSIWGRLWYKLYDQFPKLHSHSIRHAIKLNKTKRILTGLPITMSDAKRSRKKWRERFALLSSGLQIRILTDVKLLGLQRLLYIGAAYRWNTMHTAWSTRLGEIGQNSPHMQVLIVPNSAAQQMKRILPSCIQIDWSIHILNLNLFNMKTKRWELQTEKITDSIHDGIRRKYLTKKIRERPRRPPVIINETQAKILDMYSHGIYLSNSEEPKYWKYHRITKTKTRSVLSKLVKDGIADLYYMPVPVDLVSILTLVQGKQDVVHNMVDGLMQSTPTSLAMIGKERDPSIVISRIPITEVNAFIKTITNESNQSGLVVRCMKPRAIKRYTLTLFQRLLKEDGTWNDDISGFISQARSRTIE